MLTASGSPKADLQFVKLQMNNVIINVLIIKVAKFGFVSKSNETTQSYMYNV